LKIAGTILKHHFLKFSVIAVLNVFLSGPAIASDPDTLFRSDEIINIELRADFSAIQVDRVENPGYHDGELIYQAKDGKTVKLPVKVEARGDFRRDPVNCSFPPLLLNFKIREVKNTLFDNQDKLKLVTPCHNDIDVIDEYLIYKMYNKVTDRSFKVRLVNILYFDTGKGKKLFEKYSFFIEHEDQVAERNNSHEIIKFLTPYDLDSKLFRETAFFEYMVGNSDWHLSSRRNVVILQPNDTTQLPYAIPYDFDFAGFVNAEYTKPKDVPEEFLVERRAYKGLCYTTEEYNEVFTTFRSLKPLFESVINDMPLIPKTNKSRDIAYLKKFYKIIEDNDMVKQEFIDKCQSRKTYNLPEK
jgi:hypothetical protein